MIFPFLQPPIVFGSIIRIAQIHSPEQTHIAARYIPACQILATTRPPCESFSNRQCISLPSIYHSVKILVTISAPVSSEIDSEEFWYTSCKISFHAIRAASTWPGF